MRRDGSIFGVSCILGMGARWKPMWEIDIDGDGRRSCEMFCGCNSGKFVVSGAVGRVQCFCEYLVGEHAVEEVRGHFGGFTVEVCASAWRQ